MTCGSMTCLWSKRKRSTKETSWIREQYPMYLMMILTMSAPQTDTEISYQRITSGGNPGHPQVSLHLQEHNRHCQTHHIPLITHFTACLKTQITALQRIHHPPDHTLIIEANIRASDKEKTVSLDNFWRHRILTSCGDDRVTRGVTIHCT